MNSVGKLIVIIVCLAISGTVQAGPNPPVMVVGKMRDVMEGDSKARIRIDDLTLNHLYGVGPLADLDGEITIIDGRISLARVQVDGSIRVDHATTCSAPFLVYSRVNRWSEVNIPSAIVSETQLEQFVEESAKRLGLDDEAPFPFLVRANFKSISFHVVRTRAPDHRASFTAPDVLGRLVGFFSKHDQGIFTHHDSFVHMHLEANSPNLSGHVDSLQLGPSSKAVLYLPSPNRDENHAGIAP